jgi:uncharacterized protein with HEPN domain
MLSLREFLYHILDEVNYVLKHTDNLTENNFLEDETLTRAVIRSLEIIGEATKKLPADFKDKYPHVEWKKMAGARDVLIHDYFGVDWEIVWDIIKTKLPQLKEDISGIIEDIKGA